MKAHLFFLLAQHYDCDCVSSSSSSSLPFSESQQQWMEGDQGDSPISPSPCRFGWGLVSSRCQSAKWSPPPADSCKATHVHATRTKWCWEETLSVEQQKPLLTNKFLTLKLTRRVSFSGYWGLNPPDEKGENLCIPLLIFLQRVYKNSSL